MKPYPNNNIYYDVITPNYVKYDTPFTDSRYSIYKKIDNIGFPALEIKLENKITKKETYQGYYHTTSKNETLYQISKMYYNDEKFW